MPQFKKSQHEFIQKLLKACWVSVTRHYPDGSKEYIVDGAKGILTYEHKNGHHIYQLKEK